MAGEETNWSELVEDLVAGGDSEKAVCLLESVVSKLEASDSSQSDSLQLSSALFDLSKFYSSQGFSLKADEARSRGLLVRERSRQTRLPQSESKTAKDLSKDAAAHNEASISNGSTSGHQGKPSELQDDTSPGKECSDDDWEAIADRAPDELLSPKCLPEVSKLSVHDDKDPTPKRRGRGTFSYRTDSLYSDQLSDGSPNDYSENEAVCRSSEQDARTRNLNYGSRHVLVLADFPPSTTTTDLEKLLENFKNRVVIRWVNDTVALAVFRSPSIAFEAHNYIKCTFTVRVLEEDDVLLSSIPPRDLEPPRQRPETSTSTARRLIAHGMGMRLEPTNLGSGELRKQKEARRKRIVSRQDMKYDAWGDDES